MTGPQQPTPPPHPTPAAGVGSAPPPAPPAGNVVAFPPPGGRGTRRLGVWIAAGVAALLLIGLGVTLAVRAAIAPDEREREGPLASVAWTVTYATEWDLKNQDSDRPYAIWTAGDVVVRAQPDGVIGYRVADGQQAWAVPAPQDRQVCAAPQRITGTLTAVLVADKKTGCSTLLGIDLAAGKQTWTRALPAADSSHPRTDWRATNMAVAGGKILINDASTAVRAYDAATGRPGWTYTGGTTGDGILTGLGASATTAIVGVQGLFSRTPPSVAGVDLATGRQKWMTPQGDGHGLAVVISGSPPVATTRLGGDRAAIIALTDTGSFAVAIPQRIDGRIVKILGPVSGDEAAGLPAAVHGNTLYVFADGNGRYLHAIDLATGDTRWTSRELDRSTMLGPVDDQSVTLLEPGLASVDEPTRLLHLAAADGAVRTLAEVEAPELEYQREATLVRAGNTYVVVPWSRRGNTHALLGIR
ncbi:hypothetical protein GCM10010123_19310 [Pilimelia anulata]|uniref:Pyrrolo-quinoline quinone repeat domain-containing protein n=1 Tax=Pilimelia anulata TaxID=53371 RepID=A0A8J3B364_9ACTN|nr:PQQ-binding-like beta-propeller repeat protein [Pilimelia anulata]GGJ89678.1 hypothetical protein GCM10010123_19310 [Pilimelia anulata]